MFLFLLGKKLGGFDLVNNGGGGGEGLKLWVNLGCRPFVHSEIQSSLNHEI